MIAITLRFDDDLFPTYGGKQAGKFLLEMVKENPSLAVQAAQEFQVKGDFGVFTERREP